MLVCCCVAGSLSSGLLSVTGADSLGTPGGRGRSNTVADLRCQGRLRATEGCQGGNGWVLVSRPLLWLCHAGNAAFQFCCDYWSACFPLLVARTLKGSGHHVKLQFISASLSCLGQVPRPLSLEKLSLSKPREAGQNPQLYPQDEGRASVRCHGTSG